MKMFDSDGIPALNSWLGKKSQMSHPPKSPGINQQMYAPVYAILEAAADQSRCLHRLIGQANTCSLNSHTPECIRGLVKNLVAEIQVSLNNCQNYLRSIYLTSKEWDSTSSVSDNRSVTVAPTRKKKRNFDDVPQEEYQRRLSVIESMTEELKNGKLIQPIRPLKEGEFKEVDYKQGDIFSLEDYPEMVCEVKEITPDGQLFAYLHKGQEGDEFWKSGTYHHFPVEWTKPAKQMSAPGPEFVIGDLFRLKDNPQTIFRVAGKRAFPLEIWGTISSGDDPRYPQKEKCYVFPAAKIEKVLAPIDDFSAGNYFSIKAVPGTIGRITGTENTKIDGVIVAVSATPFQCHSVGAQITIDESNIIPIISSPDNEDHVTKYYRVSDQFTLHSDVNSLFEVCGILPDNKIKGKCLAGNTFWKVNDEYVFLTNYTIPRKSIHRYSVGDYFRMQCVKAEIFEVVSIENEILKGRFVKGYLSSFQIGEVYKISASVTVPVEKSEVEKKASTPFKVDDLVCLKNSSDTIGLVQCLDKNGFPEVQILKSTEPDSYETGNRYNIDPSFLKIYEQEDYKVGDYFRFADSKQMIAQVLEVKPLALLAVVVRGDSQGLLRKGNVHEIVINDKIKKTTRPLQFGDSVKLSSSNQAEFEVIDANLFDITEVRVKCLKGGIGSTYVPLQSYVLAKRLVNYASEPETRNFFPGQYVRWSEDDSTIFSVKEADPNANQIKVVCLHSSDQSKWAAGKEYMIKTVWLVKINEFPEHAIVGIGGACFVVKEKVNDRVPLLKCQCLLSTKNDFQIDNNYSFAAESLIYPVPAVLKANKKVKFDLLKVLVFEDGTPHIQARCTSESNTGGYYTKDVMYSAPLGDYELANSSDNYLSNDTFTLNDPRIMFRACCTLKGHRVLAECLESESQKFVKEQIYVVDTKDTFPVAKSTSLDCIFDSGDMVKLSKTKNLEFVFRCQLPRHFALCTCVKSENKGLIVGKDYPLKISKLSFVEPNTEHKGYHRIFSNTQFRVLFEMPGQPGLVKAICEKRGEGSPFLDGESYVLESYHLSCFKPTLFHKNQEVCRKGMEDKDLYFTVEEFNSQEVRVQCEHHWKNPPYEFHKTYVFNPFELVPRMGGKISCGDTVKLREGSGTFFKAQYGSVGETFYAECIQTTQDSDYAVGEHYNVAVRAVEKVSHSEPIAPGYYVRLKNDSHTKFYVQELDGSKVKVHSLIDLPPYARYHDYSFDVTDLEITYPL